MTLNDFPAFSGGSNGGNGPGEEAGKGSGDDLSAYPMEHFTLTPGKGGAGLTNDRFCGGGGGVLVDGEGPERKSPHVGEGYGGGGGTSAQAGIILIEVRQVRCRQKIQTRR